MAEVIDMTKDMTLEDIGARDRDNHELVWKTCRAYKFIGPKAAMQAGKFMGETLHKCLVKFGINLDLAVRNAMSPLFRQGRSKATVVGNAIDHALLLKGVRVERRTYPDPKEALRSGFYVYYQNEIAYFISEPFAAKTIKANPNVDKGEKMIDLRSLKARRADELVIFTNFKG